MYRRMLVPLDGSELSEVVFPYARELAGGLGLDVILLHVHSPVERGTKHVYRAYIKYQTELLKRRLAKVVKRIGVSSEGKALSVQGAVVEGYPAEEILRYAGEKEIDFILMATHGYSGVKRWALGSVAEKVLHISKVPIWLVRASVPEQTATDTWSSRTILVPLDGSELAEGVLPHAEAIAKQRDAELIEIVLLRVIESPIVSDHYFRNVPVTKEEVSQYLDKIERRLKHNGLKVRSQILEGDPAEQIISYASKNPSNLIVMSTHARSGIGRWFYGSVTDTVLHRASSPVFLVRPE
jgi:nucleotide-binding universal stress UspA family protein